MSFQLGPPEEALSHVSCLSLELSCLSDLQTTSHDEWDYKNKGLVKPSKITQVNVIEQFKKKSFKRLMQLKR